MTKISRDASAHSRFNGLVMNDTSVVQYECRYKHTIIQNKARYINLTTTQSSILLNVKRG